MKTQQLAIMDMIRSLKRAAQIKVSRNFTDFLSDRIVQASTQPTLLAFCERLGALLDSDLGYISNETVAAFTKIVGGSNAVAVLDFIREYPRIIAMIVSLKTDEEYLVAVKQIEITSAVDKGTAIKARPAQVQIEVRCESPLAHGSDNKAGNATLFRRCQILSTTDQTLTLPFYAGNALRGQIRDLLADHFCTTLGLTPNMAIPPVELWFFHALYAGGALEEKSKQGRAISAKLGNNGALKVQGIHELRNMIPHLSTLGYAIGNRIISGRVNVFDLHPRCAEWGTGKVSASTLMEWTYLTRRDDHEGHSDSEHHGMIANTECLRTGTVMDGGLDISDHATEIEASAIGKALELLAKKGLIGAENRRGMGRVNMTIKGAPTSEAYCKYLEENKGTILKYLVEIGALKEQVEF